MANKKISLQLEINTSFVGKGVNLLKEVESQFDKIDLSKRITRGLNEDITKSFKNLYSDLNKISSVLSKKGLNAKEYTTAFNNITTGMSKSINTLSKAGEEYTKIFKGEANKEGLRALKERKALLEDIKKIQTSMKQSASSASRTSNKLKEEFGLDSSNSYVRDTLRGLSEKRAANRKADLSSKEAGVLGKYSNDEAAIKRIIELFGQEANAISKVAEKRNLIKDLAKEEGIKTSFDNIIPAIEESVTKLQEGVITAEEYKKTLSSLGVSKEIIDRFDPTLINDYNKALKDSEVQAEKTAKAQANLREVMAQFGVVLSAGALARSVKNLIKESFDFYKSLDSALNEIYVVSNLTSERVDGLKDNFINMAKKTGMALDDVTRSAVLFYQQGLRTDEVLTMTEVTAQFAKVAGIDATDAANKLTAAVNGYCLAAEDAANVADKFNKIAAVSAADINELSTAFSKAAAQANQAGVSMDNYLAYIATMEEATREAPENIGTGLKTIFSRMQQIKKGENTDDNVDVNAVETALRSVGIELRDTEGQLRDLEQVFDDLGPKWNTLDRNTQAYLGTIIAGTRQQSRFITLMQNWSRVQDLAAESENSAGQQALMHAKAMESIESKLNQLKVAWQEFVSNLTSSSTFKNVIDFFKNFLNMLNSGRKPIILLTTAIVLFSSKLRQLQDPLKRIGKDLKEKFANSNGDLKKMLFGSTMGKKALGEAKEQNSQAIEQKEKQLTENRTKLLTINEKIAEAEEKRKATSMEAVGISEEEINLHNQKIQEETQYINELKKERNGIESNIQANEEDLEVLKKKKVVLENTNTKMQAFGKVMSSIGPAVAVLGAGLAQSDEYMGALVTDAGQLATGIGQIASGNIIGGLVNSFMGAVQFFHDLGRKEEIEARKLTEAVNKVKEATSEAINKNTATKQLGSMIKDYDKLSRKVYKTAAEQEKFNTLVQDMADSNNLDVVVDEYGNLSLNIDAVKEKYKELRKERDEALADLEKTEKEEMKNSNNRGEFIKQIYSQNSSEYRALLVGIQDNMQQGARAISEATYSSFSAAFKDSISTIISSNKEAYFEDGFAQAFQGMEDGINDAVGNSAEGWDFVYEKISDLQRNINNMSWDEFTNNFDAAFENWRKEIGLTADQWMALKEAIQSTILGDQQYVSFMNEHDTKNGRFQLYQEQLEEMYNVLDKDLKNVQMYFTDDAFSSATYLATQPGKWVQSTMTPEAVGTDQILQYYRNQKKKHGKDYEGLDLGDTVYETTLSVDSYVDLFGLSLAKEEEINKKLGKYIAIEEKMATKFTEGEMRLYNVMSKNVNGTQRGYITSVGSLFDTSLFVNDEGEEDDTTKKAKEQYQNIIADILESGKDFATKTDWGLDIIKKINERLASGKIEDENVILQLREVKKEIESEMSRTGTFTWETVFGSVESYTEDLKKANNALKELRENGAVTDDTFQNLANSLDNLNMEDVFNSFGANQVGEATDYIYGLVDALENLDVEYDINTGYVKMNGDALEYIREAQERAAKGKIESLIKDMKASKANAEVQVGYIDAQISAVEAMIKYIDAQGDEKVNVADMMSKADAEYNNVFGQVTNNLEQNYSDLADSSAQWAKATIYNIAEVSDAWSKYWQARRDGVDNADQLRNEAENVTRGYFNQKDFKSATGVDLSSINGLSASSKEVQAKRAELANYLQGLKESRAQYAAVVALYQGKISLLEAMRDSDLGNLGTGGGSDKDSGSLNHYIGQLKEIYNILNRIELLEHRLSTLDTYSDIAKGEEYGSLLQERLNYNSELLDQYEFLVSEQKQFTNGYKDFIGSVKGLEGVFDFDQFGQIIINWEKYTALQDTAAKGETTLKEKADDVYNTYTSMFKELQGYFDNYIKYLQNTLKLLNEARDSYVSLENKTANAVKEIYQKILTTKLEAIDREKEALNDLKKARDQANKDTKNAKELSNLQTNMQRTLMDTSGASDSAFIKAQMDMNDKLDEIAEDKYSTMLQDLQDTLDDEKEMLQQEFDDMFDRLDWLYDFLDQSIMSDSDSIQNILKQTDEWNQKSPTERWADVREWDTLFNSYFKTDIFSEKGIKGVLNEIVKNENRIAEIDNVLKNQNTKGDANIIQTIEKWGQNVSNAASSSRGGSGGNYVSGGGNPTGGNPNATYKYGTYTKKEIDAYQVPINPDVYKGHFSTKDNNGVYYQPDNVGGDKLRKTGQLAKDIGITVNSSGKDVSNQNVWGVDDRMNIYVWNGTKGVYENVGWLRQFKGNEYNSSKHQKIKFLQGGLANFTGPAWMDGTPTQPEAVLNALQTKHFINFADALSKMYSGVNGAIPTMGNSINVGSISFEVESMSSPEDGEKAFNMFVDKFKEIGNQTGIKINTFKNTL